MNTYTTVEYWSVFLPWCILHIKYCSNTTDGLKNMVPQLHVLFVCLELEPKIFCFFPWKFYWNSFFLNNDIYHCRLLFKQGSTQRLFRHLKEVEQWSYSYWNQLQPNLFDKDILSAFFGAAYVFLPSISICSTLILWICSLWLFC